MTREQTTHLKKKFLEAFASYGNVSAAAQAAGIRRREHYRWLEKDRKYAEEFADAELQAADALEMEARRRAQVGVWTGKTAVDVDSKVKRIMEYSDTLLIFLLKGLKPEKYRERFDHRHGVTESLADLIVESRKDK